MRSQIMETAEPFFFPGGPTGVLLVHGFTSTPKEMRWMGEYLAGRGYTVLGMRLAGHATRVEDLSRFRWQDWLASVEDGWHLLAGSCKTLFAAGLSMGGVLSLVLAARYPLAGVVTMSSPYDLPYDPRLPYLRWIHMIKPFVKKGPPDWRNPEAAASHVTYTHYPTRSIAELNLLLAEMRSCLPSITIPALTVHSRGDRGVPLQAMENIYQHLGSHKKSQFILQDSGHIVTREPERQQLFERVDQFFQEVLTKPV